jgi:hypothetical protein
MSSVIITLDYPLADGGSEVTELKLRRPKVRDQLAASHQKGSDADQELALFANLCDLTPALIEELDIKDYRKLQEAYMGFLD